MIVCDVRIKSLENRSSGSEFGLVGGGGPGLDSDRLSPHFQFVGREMCYTGHTEQHIS